MWVDADRGDKGMDYLVMSVGVEIVEGWILCNMKGVVSMYHFCKDCTVDKGKNECVLKNAITAIVTHCIDHRKI